MATLQATKMNLGAAQAIPRDYDALLWDNEDI